MAQPSWEVDPIEGAIYTLIDGERHEAVGSVNIGGTEYLVSGGRLVSANDPSQFYNLGRQGSSYLTDLVYEGMTLSNQIRFESLNDPVSPTIMRGYSGDVSVQFSSGEVRSVNVPFMAVAPQGGRIFAWRPSADSPWRYDSTTAQTLEELLGRGVLYPDIRWASALEVAQRAVGRALLRDQERLILDYARDQGLYKDNGEPDFSGAFHMLLDAASISMDAARSARVITGG